MRTRVVVVGWTGNGKVASRQAHDNESSSVCCSAGLAL